MGWGLGRVGWEFGGVEVRRWGLGEWVGDWVDGGGLGEWGLYCGGWQGWAVRVRGGGWSGGLEWGVGVGWWSGGWECGGWGLGGGGGG